MSKSNSNWPPIREHENRSRNLSYYVDIGLVDGKRKRPCFPSLKEAKAYADLARKKRAEEGMQAFQLPSEAQLDAVRALKILAPHGVSIFECAKHYEATVLAYKNAPLVKDIVAKFLEQGTHEQRCTANVERQTKPHQSLC
jgi:hypothetical protein